MIFLDFLDFLDDEEEEDVDVDVLAGGLDKQSIHFHSPFGNFDNGGSRHAKWYVNGQKSQHSRLPPISQMLHSEVFAKNLSTAGKDLNFLLSGDI